MERKIAADPADAKQHHSRNKQSAGPRTGSHGRIPDQDQPLLPEQVN
jgi:hypothetical protein